MNAKKIAILLTLAVLFSIVGYYAVNKSFPFSKHTSNETGHYPVQADELPTHLRTNDCQVAASKYCDSLPEGRRSECLNAHTGGISMDCKGTSEPPQK